MAFRTSMKRLGVVGAVMVALTMFAVALSGPANAATTTGTLQNYHTGVYLADNNVITWTHSVDTSSSVIQNTGTHRCLYNPGGNSVAVGACSPTNHAYLWQASSVVSISGTLSYQFRNYHTGTCLYMSDAGGVYLDTCSSNHADYWH